VLKKLAATGILAAAATGVMLSAVPADASTGSQKAIDPCVTVPGLYTPPAWCNTYTPPAAYYPPTYYAPPTYAPPTYYPGYGWDRWHRNPWHWHR
jgi:hypothetical protein